MPSTVQRRSRTISYTSIAASKIDQPLAAGVIKITYILNIPREPFGKIFEVTKAMMVRIRAGKSKSTGPLVPNFF